MKRRCLKLDSDAEEKEEEDEDEICNVKNTVYFYAEVNTKNVLKMIKALNSATQFALESSYDMNTCAVYLYINSYGGDACGGLSAMDHVRLNRVHVVTIADGYVASAATLMFLGGHERKILRNAKILIHQLSTGFWGKYKDLLDEVANSKELMKNFQDIYKSHTRMTEKEVQDLLNKEIHMNAQQSLDCGFVDEIW
jgi:ATP-dependent protease ClpP protease subunit